MNAVLRPLNAQDLPMVRAWRNHPKINDFMCSQNFISESEHQQWFEESLTNTLKFLYIYEESERAMGFIQLQKKSFESAVYGWGFYIDPTAPKGTGFKMTSLALQKAFKELSAHKLCAEVLGFNQASIQLHLRLGFDQEGVLKQHHFLNGQYSDVHFFGKLHSSKYLNKGQSENRSKD